MGITFQGGVAHSGLLKFTKPAAAAPSAAYTISQSCRFNDDDAPELSLTYSITAPWTFSAWIKRCELGAVNNLLGTSGEIYFNASDQLVAEALTTTAVFRDPSAWLHVHVSNNGLYINGVSYGSVTTTTLTNAKLFDDFDGYAAEVHLKSGTDAVTNYGEFDSNGNWVPLEATSGEHYLTFSNSAALGENSGSGGNWTATNLTSADQVTDSPTDDVDNDVGNYCTFSPINKRDTSQVLVDGNLEVSSATNDSVTATTIALPKSGKVYVEFKLTQAYDGSGGGISIGCMKSTVKLINTAVSSGTAGFANYTNSVDGKIDSTGAGSFDLTGLTRASVNDYVQIAWDSGKWWVGVNNTWLNSGNPSAGTNEIADLGTDDDYVLATASRLTKGTSILNTGQSAFQYTPPTDFVGLSSAIYPTPTITDPSAYFQPYTYTGNGSVRSLTFGGNSNLQPDLVWIKNRDAADENKLIDAVRGVTKELSSDSTNVEQTDANGLTSFDTNGFSLGTGANGYNDNTEEFVAWAWKEGATPGMDIVTYSGTGTAHTENHSLGAAPALMIVKSTVFNGSGSANWMVYHQGTAADAETDYLSLDGSAAVVDDNTVWNDTAPTSSVFTVGTHKNVNDNSGAGSDYVAYLFAGVEGFSKFGTYTGNGSTDGPFIYCGFRPAFLMIKKTSGTGNWWAFDNVRDGYNVSNNILMADLPDAETAGSHIDLLSNGFKVRATSTSINTSSGTYVYAAFAEHPFGGNGVAQARAR